MAPTLAVGAYQRAVERAHESLSTAPLPLVAPASGAAADPSAVPADEGLCAALQGLRREVRESWLRSLAALTSPRLPGEADPATLSDADLTAARREQHGAEVTVNANVADPSVEIQEKTGGAHGVLVTAVHPQAFGQAIAMTRRGGTIVFNGLPPGDFPAPIFDIVLKGLTIRGSIVGTRQDMVEALEFYAAGKIKPTFHTRPLGDINAVFDEMRHGKIDGRVVIDYAMED